MLQQYNLSEVLARVPVVLFLVYGAVERLNCTNLNLALGIYLVCFYEAQVMTHEPYRAVPCSVVCTQQHHQPVKHSTAVQKTQHCLSQTSYVSRVNAFFTHAVFYHAVRLVRTPDSTTVVR